MAGFLDALATRAAGQAPLLTVRARARFEPAAEAGDPLTSELSDPHDPSAPSQSEPLGSRPIAQDGVSEPVVPERLGGQTAEAHPGAPEPAFTAPVVTGRMLTGQAAADAVHVEPAATSPFGARATGTADRQMDVLTSPQPDIDGQLRAPSRAPGDASEGSTLSPEPPALHTDQPRSPSTVPPTAREPLRSRARAAESTGPDPVRVTRGRPAASVPPQALVAEHLVAALARAGVVSPNGTDTVRSDPAWEASDGRETVGATGVPEVHVHIGRVEVTQAPSAPSPNQPAQPPAPAPPTRARSRLPAVDHGAYLARRRRSDRDAR